MTDCIILLTACINPDGMPLTTLTDVGVRKQQYHDAINFYLTHTNLPIVFAENSGTRLDIHDSERFEMLCFDGNKDKTHGKGFGECEIIEYALTHSRFINKDTVIIKITGRLIVHNIQSVITQTKFMGNRVLCCMHSDLSFADSRIFSCPATFMKKFVSNKYLINDFKDMYFENVLASQLKQERIYFPYLIEPQITGVSGSTGATYYINKTKLSYKWRYIRYQLSLFRKYKNKNLQT